MRRRAGRVRAGIGRMARFVMNAMLASGGYPWTVIRVEDRDGYLVRLEIASIDQDIGPFTTLVVEGGVVTGPQRQDRPMFKRFHRLKERMPSPTEATAHSRSPPGKGACVTCSAGAPGTPAEYDTGRFITC